ncbi:hypothetical protein F5Y16DRAFT_117966 [Xylariaceae sp. FL0255]|nr:hypothetical protein F5Y16DRAFT_117966 [Xylariaceae sp. FL0255]
MPAANLAIDEVKDEPRKPSKIILRLSSAHLRLASPYFKKAMSSGWKEASLDADGLRHFDAEDWDEESLVILMRIIHRLNHHVPKKMNLERLAKIAVLVDYYQCHEVVEPFTEIWQQAAKALRPKEVGRDLVLLLFVSRTFRWHSVFETTTKTALEQCKGPLPTLHLPIPLTIVDNIDRQRLLYIDQIIDLLHGLLVDFRDGRNQCSFECSSILLGALMKELYDRGLEPKRDSLYDGHSLVSLKLAVSSIRSPKWKPVASASTFGGTPQPHSCDLASIIQLKMKDLANVEGLKLC